MKTAYDITCANIAYDSYDDLLKYKEIIFNEADRLSKCNCPGCKKLWVIFLSLGSMVVEKLKVI